MTDTVQLENAISLAQTDAENLQECIRSQKEKLADTTLPQFVNQSSISPKAVPNLRVRRILKGHLGKIYSMQWATDSRHLISASQDGKMIIWDSWTTNKKHAIALRSSWVMTCALSPSSKFVASGGLDNACSVYSIQETEAAMSSSKNGAGGLPYVRPIRELQGHIGFVSCCRFIDDGQILTSSGDTTCSLWDIERSLAKVNFRGHTGDVMSLALLCPLASNTENINNFISVGCDATARIWDIRSGKCERIFVGHESDINGLAIFPDGQSFATGSDDTTVRLFDIRADRELRKYVNSEASAAVTSISFTQSGGGLFTAYDDSNVILWDTLLGEKISILAAHESRVSSLGVSPNGNGLCTASWDSTLKIWA